MIYFFLFIFGAIVGSFLNVVGLRFNSGVSLGGRSHCAHCGETLRWWELIPIISFIILRGRCARCGSHLSIQYPLVELFTGLIFITVPYVFLPVFCLYVVILIYDARHKIIPDLLVYLSILLSAAVRLWIPSGGALDWLAGPILFFLFFLVWWISGGRAMGFADGKLALSIGLLLGAAEGFSAIIVSFWIGAVFGLVYIAFTRLHPLLRDGKQITMKSEIPFAPFLILGAWVAVIFQLDLLHVSLF